MIETVETAADELRRQVADCWPRACARWSHYLQLSDPINQPEQPGIAQIDLATRQVALHFPKITAKGLLDCVEGLLAHEIGHHVCYPGTLAVDARLRLLERSLIPIPNYSTLNLFTDLLINERLGEFYREPFVRIYQAFDEDGDWERDPAFIFYLSIYEELWRLEPGTLQGRAQASFDRVYDGYRADAQLLAQNLFGLAPNVYTQFLYFASIMSRYLRPLQGKELSSRDPNQCGCGEPSAEDWADALTPNAREQEALERARAEGWIDDKQAERMTGRNGLEARILGLPGQGDHNAERVPEVMAAYYRRQADRFLLRPPPQRILGEAVVPTSLEDWEAGDAVGDIDWLTTLVQRGDVLGAALPVKRVKSAEHEGYEVPLWQPRVEIYLDVSGSMPDPRVTRNAMTLAAMILSAGAVRAGGRVRALLYSSSPVRYWNWCRSEVELSRFLMHYIGGGTTFPFDILAKSTTECAGDQPTRLLITDTDFDTNYNESAEHAGVFAEAARLSPQLVLLQHRAQPTVIKKYRSTGARVLEIADFEDFPRLAAQLSRVLFEEKRDAHRGLVP